MRVWREAWGRCTVKADLMKVIGWNGVKLGKRWKGAEVGRDATGHPGRWGLGVSLGWES